MAYRTRTESALLLVAVLACTIPAADAANIYRYKDDRGQTVYNSSIPPEFVKNGYEILNERGQVIQVVPRAPTAAEIAAMEAEREAQQLEEEALRAQQEADNLLLRLYRSPEDIARKRDDRVRQLEAQGIALAASIAKTQDEVARLEQVVANNRNNGNEPPSQTLTSLQNQQRELERLSGQLERMETDRAAAHAEAERDIRRLSELLGLAEDTAAQ